MRVFAGVMRVKITIQWRIELIQKVGDVVLARACACAYVGVFSDTHVMRVCVYVCVYLRVCGLKRYMRMCAIVAKYEHAHT